MVHTTLNFKLSISNMEEGVITAINKWHKYTRIEELNIGFVEEHEDWLVYR